jgi:acyl-CoA thioester hydrolase
MPEEALGRWPVSIELPVAWGDMDAFAHVNNAVYLRWFESARIAYFERLGVGDRMTDDKVGPILARAAVNYRLPLTYPDTVRVEATVVRLGQTSLTMQYRVTSRAHEAAVAAEGEATVVMVRYPHGAKVPLDAAFRERIFALEAAAFGQTPAVPKPGPGAAEG